MMQGQLQTESTGSQLTENILEVENISKVFPGVQALNRVSISVRKGEVHALVGENGAGKSTLVKIIAGEYQASEGRINVQGQPRLFHSPTDASGHGIRLIHQHFPLAQSLSVGENILMNQEPVRGPFKLIDWETLHRNAQAVLDQLGVDIDSRTPVHALPVSHRQMVEIAKALAGNAQLIIMDEPTSALGQDDIEHLFGIIEKLKRDGISILYVSHKLDEIFQIGDRVTVLRDGSLVGTREIKMLSADELISMMVGRSVKDMYPYIKGLPEETVFEVRNLSLDSRLSDISLTARKGEILGIIGLIGSGLEELAACIFGLTKPSSGTILIDGKPIPFHSPLSAIQAGLMLVPQDRWHTGLCLGLSVRENVSLANLDRLCSRGFVIKQRERDLVNESRKRMNIIAASMDMPVKNLSGGNQQKVVLAKSLATRPRVLILDSPTVGIDVGSKAEIYKLLSGLARDQQVAVIVLSQELPEILGVCDRMLVLRNGCLQDEFQRDQATMELVRKSMSGLPSCQEETGSGALAV